jgi:hypothetical protein
VHNGEVPPRAALGSLLALAGCALSLDESALTGGAPSACPVDGAILCEGFEDGLTPGLWRFPIGSEPEAVAVVDDGAARGRRALAVTAPAIGEELAETRGEITADLPLAEVYRVRLFAFFPSEGDPTASNEARVLKIAQSSPPLSGVQIQLAAEEIEIHVGLTGVSRFLPWTLPRDRWFCLTAELEVATEGAVSVWLDDEPLGALEGDTSTPEGAPPYGAITVGLTFPDPALPQAAYTARFDEVLVSTGPLGCAD